MIKQILVLMLAATAFAACSNEPEYPASTTDPKEWPLGSTNPNYRPGDDFFMFCNASWYNSVNLGSQPLDGCLYEVKKRVEQQIKELDNPRIKKFRADVKNVDQTTAQTEAMVREALKIADNIQTKEDAYTAISKSMQEGHLSVFTLGAYSKGGRIYALFAMDSLIRDDIPEEWHVDYLKTAGLTENQARGQAHKAAKIQRILSQIPQRDLSHENLQRHPELHDKIISLRSTRSGFSAATELVNAVGERLGIAPDDIKVSEELLPILDELMQSDISELQAYIQLGIANDFLLTSHKAIESYNQVSSQESASQKKLTMESLAVQIRRAYMNYLYSYAYITEHVPSERKELFKGICEEIRSAFKDRINSLTWMSGTTKQKAQEKLASMKFNIGYPDRWVEEGLAELTGTSLLEDVIQLRKARLALYKSFIGKNSKDASFDIAISEYDSDLTVVNASYSPIYNSMNIYPAFMLDPLYKENVSDAYNYAIFSVIGHEITHGFDNEGAKYNSLGDQENWWTVADKMEFTERQNRIIQCYNMLEIMPEALPGVYGNGQSTLGENIADLGGVMVAYQTYIAKAKREGYSGAELEKQERKFYQAYAELFRIKYSVNEVQRRLREDPHSAGRNRINGVVMNSDRWYELYDVKWGDKLYLKPEKRTYIW